ncbi:MAG: vitamin B12 dependent-methionine synthase activation domain-containing protein [Smithella sp.]|nr:vitamin B12 dependent-methionine synthase activation domain-containing protein [Smithella sp.]
MTAIILDQITFRADLSALSAVLRLRKDTQDEKRLMVMLDQARSLAKPKGAYTESFIEEMKDDYVIIDGVRLNGNLLPVNLIDVKRVFPYLATCGTELEEWSAGVEGLRERFWADTIMMFALGSAIGEIDRHIEKNSNPGKRSSMNPGSLKEWPIEEQKGLFEILGDADARIGVKLQKSFMMYPLKSVSGIFFPSEHSYENCRLCSREKCPGRRAPFDACLREDLFIVPH